MLPETAQFLRECGGVVLRSTSPRRYDWLVRHGDLVVTLPGVAVPRSQAQSLVARALALAAVDPDAVVSGPSAAALTWWPELVSDELIVTAHSTRFIRTSAKGYLFDRAQIPIDLVRQVGTLRVASPALSVLEMIPSHGGECVDEALRRGATSLTDIHAALDLTPNRPGNQVRRVILHDSRDEPWSGAERLAHRRLRSEGLSGWVANLPVAMTPSKLWPRTRAYLDLGFPEAMLGIEVDGATYHSTAAAQQDDRLRDVALSLLGWQIVRFPASAVGHPRWPRTVRALLDVRHAGLGGASGRRTQV